MQKLIERYQELRQLTTDRDYDEECDENFEKCGIIEELVENFEQKSVQQLVLQILRDENDYDLARIDLLKHIELVDFNEFDKSFGENIAQIILSILENPNDDYLVRQYAGIALVAVIDFPNVLNKAIHLTEIEQDKDTKVNILSAINRN